MSEIYCQKKETKSGDDLFWAMIECLSPKTQRMYQIYDEFSGSNKQYITTVNQNQLNEIKKYLKEEKYTEIITKNTVFTLTDEKSSEKLLGISVDISED